MLTLAPLILGRDCFRADAVGPPATETAAATWSLADCTTLDFSCTSSNSSAPAAESGKLCDNALQVDEVASLTEALKSEAPNLVSLELRGNWVGPLKGAALATALQAHPSLEFLGLASTALLSASAYACTSGAQSTGGGVAPSAAGGAGGRRSASRNRWSRSAGLGRSPVVRCSGFCGSVCLSTSS